MRTLEAAVLAELKQVAKNSKIRQKDIMEWSTGDVKAREGETYYFLPELKVQVCVKLPVAKSKVIRANQSPLNKSQWHCDLECGCSQWVTAKQKPRMVECASPTKHAPDAGDSTHSEPLSTPEVDSDLGKVSASLPALVM
jgi:hypothetical protein